MKKKVLIIVREFVPYCLSLGSSMRILKMAEFFMQNGIEVFILAGKCWKISYYGYEKLVRDMKVKYVPDLLFIYHAGGYESLNKNDIKKQSLIKRLNTKFIIFVMKFIAFFDPIFVPDMFVCTNYLYYKKATELIEKEKIKNVVISSPPHSIQLIGPLLKKKYGNKINLIIDYRDSWNLMRFRKMLYPLRHISEYLEKKILKNTDYFIYVSSPILNKINKNYFDITKKSLLVMNGYDENIRIDNWNGNVRSSVLTLGHFGSIYENPRYHRDLTLFFKALLKFNGKIKLCLYGDVIISKKWQDKMRGILEIGGNLPHIEALKMMKKMDVLLILHSRRDEWADEVITGKFFDYVFAEKPILLVGPTNMEVAKMIEKDGLGYVADIFSEESMLKTLDKIYKDWETGKLVKYKRENFKHYSRQYQYRKILEILI